MLTFKKQGITSILISHKLKEVLKVSDHITVLRDGQSIKSFDAKSHKLLKAKLLSIWLVVNCPIYIQNVLIILRMRSHLKSRIGLYIILLMQKGKFYTIFIST